MIALVEVKTKEQVEWLRVQRNEPEQYKWFRQDKPITAEQQVLWWRQLDKTRAKLFIIENGGKKIGYVGFNPLNRYASTAEFGIFIIKSEQGKGFAARALKEMLKYGFDELNLSSIYSECLVYPEEDRMKFYEGLGFVRRENQLQKTYTKQGKKVIAIPFYMTNDLWKRQQAVGNADVDTKKSGKIKS